MAYYAALVSLVQLLEDIIHGGRYRKFLLDRQQIASLHEKFSLLQASLEDYSPKDEAAADFLERRIRDAAYQAQDIIESRISTKAPPIVKAHGGKRVLIRYLISAFQKAKAQLLKDLGKVEKEVISIVEEVVKMKKSHTTADLQLNNIYSADITGASKQAPSGRNTAVGFDERLTTIKDQLSGHSSELQVLSIVGMGGIGKTTLARNVFDDGLIVSNFCCRAWVTVSQNYHPQKVLLDILNSLNINKELSKEVDNLVLGKYIYQYLIGRTYLIIIDDIWDTNVWDDVKWIFPNDSNRSRIVVTTRLLDIAVYPDRFGYLHQMQFLNEDQSWDLFREKVFCPPDLEDLGRLIANSCRGLPLAIIVIAGFLSKIDKTRYDWKEIARNVSSAATTENDEHFSKIFSLSYNHLPHHLKSCLLYLGGFPEDHEIRISKLIKLWVAEGFLKSIESKSLEEVAEGYLEDLVSRNLVLVTKMRFDGKFKCCSIHDVLRELCVQRVRHENFLGVLDKKNYFNLEVIGEVRRLCIHPGVSGSEKAKKGRSHIRSIICFVYFRKLLSFVRGSKLLRVLDASVGLFPHEILELFHLRCLALRPHGNVLKLPQSISKLQNLQILSCPEVPCDEVFDISLLPHLRHVMVGSLKLSPTPAAILENLQTLSKVTDVTVTNEVIEMIPNLRKLKVMYNTDHETDQRWQKFGLDNLVRLGQLESLTISFSKAFYGSDRDPLPESFTFPLNLKKLTLSSCRLPWKDMTVVGSLPNLQVLKLQNAFMGKEWEPVEGEFTELKFLKLELLYDLKYWRAQADHFPRLQCLEISSCWKLKEIPLEIGDIPTLELIDVQLSSRLAEKSALRIQEEQRDLGNDGIQVRVWNVDELDLSFLQEDSEEELQEEKALESKDELQEADKALESKDELQQDDIAVERKDELER